MKIIKIILEGTFKLKLEINECIQLKKKKFGEYFKLFIFTHQRSKDKVI